MNRLLKYNTFISVGRFLSVDPLWECFRNYTPYHYSFNNPISFKDPTGFAPEKEQNELQGKKDKNDKLMAVKPPFSIDDPGSCSLYFEIVSIEWICVGETQSTPLKPGNPIYTCIYYFGLSHGGGGGSSGGGGGTNHSIGGANADSRGNGSGGNPSKREGKRENELIILNHSGSYRGIDIELQNDVISNLSPIPYLPTSEEGLVSSVSIRGIGSFPSVKQETNMACTYACINALMSFYGLDPILSQSQLGSKNDDPQMRKGTDPEGIMKLLSKYFNPNDSPNAINQEDNSYLLNSFIQALEQSGNPILATIMNSANLLHSVVILGIDVFLNGSYKILVMDPSHEFESRRYIDDISVFSSAIRLGGINVVVKHK